MLFLAAGCGGADPPPGLHREAVGCPIGDDLRLTVELRGRPAGLAGSAGPSGAGVCGALPADPDRLIAEAREPELRRKLESRVGEAAGLDLEGLRFVDDDPQLRRWVRERARRRSVPGRPVVLIGWDGADPRVVEDLVRAGRLPVLTRLLGGRPPGRLRSHAPYLSPLLWTRIATGKPPSEHGVLDFVEPAPGGGARPVGSSCRRSTTIWQIASDLGRRVLVVNWWASEPAEAVNGELVSDAWVRGAGAASPPRGLARVAAGDAVVEETLGRLGAGGGSDDPRRPKLAAFVAETLTVQRVLLDRLGRERHDLVLAYFGLPDQAAHLYVREMPPRLAGVAEADFRRSGGVVLGCYLLLDALLGDVLARVPADAIVLVVSDHGFVYGHERARAAALDDPLSDALHSPLGLFVLGGAGPVDAAAPLDIDQLAPTVLAGLGIPAGADMAGAALAAAGLPAAGRVPSHEFELDPPDFPLLAGRPCASDAPPGDGGAATAAAAGEALAKLEALGYVASSVGGPPYLPLANLGRSLIDEGRLEAGIARLEAAARLRPDDAGIGLLLLEAESRRPRPDPRRLEDLARRHLRDGGGAPRGEFAFVLAELLLASGRGDEAIELAAAVSGQGVDGALTSMLVSLHHGDGGEALAAARRAAAIDPARTVDTVQALAELSADRGPRFEDLLAQLAPALPLAEVMRSPVRLLGGASQRTLDRARAALREQRRDPVSRLWLRRAAAVDPAIRMAMSSGSPAR